LYVRAYWRRIGQIVTRTNAAVLPGAGYCPGQYHLIKLPDACRAKRDRPIDWWDDFDLS